MRAAWEETLANRLDHATAAALAARSEEEARAQLSAARREIDELRVELENAGKHAEDLSREITATKARLGGAAIGADSLRQRLAACEAELERTKAEARMTATRLEAERDSGKEREEHLLKCCGEISFKMDMIARELKAADRHIEAMRGEARGLADASKKFTAYNDQQVGLTFASNLSEAAARLRGRTRDIIEECLTETQKLHVGAYSTNVSPLSKDPKDQRDAEDQNMNDC